MGGEKKSSRCCTSIGLGSPPHRRGKAEQQAYEQLQSGITPAQAGKRRQSSHCLRPDRDHPRAGGEKTEYAKRLPPCQGLPPHRRGKVAGAACRDLLGGITPAWAGKSLYSVSRSVGFQDHPRVGGEKRLRPTVTQSPTGSPPRGRGKVHNLGYEYTYLMDHPRVGGEKAKANCRHFWPVGSPPRGRGKVVAFILAYVAVGITPAWAGKSCWQ